MADAQLLQYIQTQKQAGYSDAQIKQALITNGYTPLIVEDSFNKLKKGSNTVDPQLLSLVNQYLQGGMTPTQVTATLSTQGYQPQQIRKAIHDTIGSVDSGHHRGVMIFFIILAAMVAGGFLVMILQQQSSPTSNAIQKSPEAITGEVLSTINKDGKDAAVRTCKNVLVSDDRDNCIWLVAVSSDKVGPQDDIICEQIYDIKIHDSCLLSFIAEDNRFDAVCSRVKLPESIKSCDDVRAIRGATAK